ncbi:MAG: hypothetical protein ACK6DI_05995, partial [Betaproteobacteria bacterium]
MQEALWLFYYNYRRNLMALLKNEWVDIFHDAASFGGSRRPRPTHLASMAPPANCLGHGHFRA